MSTTTTTPHKAAAVLPTQADLKAISQETGVCLSILLPIDHANRQSDATRMRVAMQDAQDRLAQAGLTTDEIDEMLRPVKAIAETEQSERSSPLSDGGTHGLAIYRSVEGLWHFRLPFALPEYTAVASRFHVVPILKALSYTPEFYILPLSQKHTRLIHCTLGSSEEVPLPPSVPTNLFDFNQQAQPDHRLENRSSGGQKGSSHTHPGIMVAFGTGSDVDHKDEYLYHFYNELDKQLQVLLRDKPLPLVLSGVDYELALYHRVSEYPALVAGGVHGAADGLKGGELHTRALQVLEEYNQTRTKEALQRYEKAGGDRMSTDLAEIVHHAADARVLYLFVAEGAQHPGTFNEDTREVRYNIAEGSEDLLNMAALHTIATAGEVFVVPPDQVPGHGQAAAMLRF